MSSRNYFDFTSSIGFVKLGSSSLIFNSDVTSATNTERLSSDLRCLLGATFSRALILLESEESSCSSLYM